MGADFARNHRNLQHNTATIGTNPVQTLLNALLRTWPGAISHRPPARPPKAFREKPVSGSSRNALASKNARCQSTGMVKLPPQTHSFRYHVEYSAYNLRHGEWLQGRCRFLLDLTMRLIRVRTDDHVIRSNGRNTTRAVFRKVLEQPPTSTINCRKSCLTPFAKWI